MRSDEKLNVSFTLLFVNFKCNFSFMRNFLTLVNNTEYTAPIEHVAV